MNEKKFELFKVTTKHLAIEQDGNKQFGNWSEIKWRDCLRIGAPLARLLEEVLGLKEGQIFNKEAHEYAGDICYPSVSFFLHGNEGEPNNLDQKLVEQVASEFLFLVIKNHKKNLSVHHEALKDPAVKGIVKVHSENFLESNGDKKLSTPLQLESFSLSVANAGSFAAKPPPPPFDPVKFTVSGRVVGMHSLERTCILFEPKNLTIVHYNENYHFLKLKNMLGEPLEAKFFVEKTRDANGKYLILLHDFAIIAEKDRDVLL